MGGWLKSYHKIIESDIFESPRILKLWTYLLHRANFKESKIMYGYEQRILHVGQVWFCATSESKKLKMPKSTIFRDLKYLEKTDRIRNESGPKGFIITICNYIKYQQNDSVDGPKVVQDWSKVGPDLVQDWSYPKTLRIKEGKNKELNTSPKLKVSTAGSILFEAYSKAYEAKYKITPIRDAKNNSIAKKLVEMIGVDNIENFISQYFKSVDKFYLLKCHPLSLALNDAQKILTESHGLAKNTGALDVEDKNRHGIDFSFLEGKDLE